MNRRDYFAGMVLHGLLIERGLKVSSEHSRTFGAPATDDALVQQAVQLANKLHSKLGTISDENKSLRGYHKLNGRSVHCSGS